jgi:hypothetical protein
MNAIRNHFYLPNDHGLLWQKHLRAASILTIYFFMVAFAFALTRGVVLSIHGQPFKPMLSNPEWSMR